MNQLDRDSIEAFEYEAEMVQKTIKDLVDGKITPEEIERKQELKNWKIKLDEEERKKEKEKKLRLGREGKGEKFNYINLCKHCFVEYDIPTPVCPRCGGNTVSKEERKAELAVKVQDLRTRTQHHKERKMQWENWIKTKALTHRKFLNNYKKWDFFEEDSEDEKEQPPIVPNDDPNFKALEQDINDRAKKRKESLQKSEKLKVEGNVAMSKGHYQKAVKKYSEAIELSKDYFPLYTNRALANIKMEKWQEVITDCSKVLEYLECFEEGYEKSKDVALKCLMRKALANQKLKSFDTAITDCEQALKLFPKYKELEVLLENVKHDKAADQKGNEVLKTPKPDIDSVIDKWGELLSQKDPKQEEFDKILEKLITLLKNKDNQIYFLRKNGYKIIEHSLQSYYIGIVPIISDLVTNNDLVGEIVDLKLIDRLIESIATLYEKADVSIEFGWRSFEVLETLSLSDRTRIEICKCPILFKMYSKCLNHIKKSYRFESFFSLMANTFYHGGVSGENKYLSHILAQTLEMLKLCVETLDDNKEDRMFKLTLYTSICSFVRNMITIEKLREDFPFSPINKYISDVFKRNCNLAYDKSEYFCEYLIDVYTNASLSIKFCDWAAEYELVVYCENLFTYTKDDDIKSKLIGLVARLCKSKKAIPLLEKCINIHKKCMQVIITKEFKLIPESLRMLSYQFDTKRREISLYEVSNTLKSLAAILSAYYKQSDFVNFSNACTLVGKILRLEENEKNYVLLKPNIVDLIAIVANTSSVCRKQAAILLSLLSKNEELKETIKLLHGTEVLHSIAEYVIDK